MKSVFDFEDEQDIPEIEPESPIPAMSEEQNAEMQAAWPVQTPDEANQEIEEIMAMEPVPSPEMPVEEEEVEPAPGPLASQQQSPAPQQEQAMPPVQKPQHPSDRYADLMDQYRRLQESRRNRYADLALLQGAQGIGQAIAGRYTGDFKNDTSGIKMLQGMADQPVQDFESEQKMRKVKTELGDMDKMRDANSSISKFYREMAKKRGLEVDDSMSAWDLAQMQKTMGSFGTKPNRVPTLRPFHDNVNKVDRMGSPELQPNGTTAFRDTEGNLHTKVSPFQQAYITTDAFGRQVAIGRSGNPTATPVGLPAPKMGETRKNEEPKTQDQVFQELGIKAPNDVKEIRKSQEEFSAENKEHLSNLHQIDIVMNKVDEALTNPIAASQIGSLTTGVFETGRKTDEDVARYIKQNGIFNQMSDWFVLKKDGTFDKGRADNLKKSLGSLKNQLYHSLSKRVDAKSKNTHLMTSGIDEKTKRNLIYQLPDNYAPDQKVRIKDVKTGEIKTVPANNLQKALDSKRYIKAE